MLVLLSSLITFLIMVTCPKYPSDPDSISGTSAAKHIVFTWRLASKNYIYHNYCICYIHYVYDINSFPLPRLSNAFITISNFLNHSTLNLRSLMFAWCATMLAFGLNFKADSRATYKEQSHEFNHFKKRYTLGK